MPKLTQNYVKSLPLSKDTSQKIYLDDELTGFGVRVSKRSKVFYVYMQFEGKC
jgi:hypothetical protein